MFSSKIRFDIKNLSCNFFLVYLVALYFILFNTVSYSKCNFKLKVDSKKFTYKNLEEILKTLKKNSKINIWQP